jgi:O-methyltransferase involved in polyketide biosynthesis
MSRRKGDNADETGDLSVTALYTAQTWMWAGLDGADLFATRRSRDVFNATNLALGTARIIRRDWPSLRHGLVQRHVMIDHLLADSGCTQVVELAAGLSRRGAAVSADPRYRYVEVDLPAMIAEKRALLAASERGRAVAARPNLTLVGHDIADLDFAEVLTDGPVFVIAEGLLVYLSAAEQDALWRRVAAVVTARPGSAFVFDLVPPGEQPQPGRMGRALESVMKRFTRGKTFATDGRSRAEITAQLHAAGFSTVAHHEPRTAPAAWNVPHLTERTQIVVWRVS